MSRNDESDAEKGASLARGPALIIGTVLLVAGLYFLYKQHTFPKLSHFPNGRATFGGKVFLGIFGVNGWSGELTAAAGGLLLFGAAQHLLAKVMSLFVGVALAVAAIWALADHHSAAGLFAANVWTIIGWGAAAALLLFNAAIPRRRRSPTSSTSSSPPSTYPPTPTPTRTPTPTPTPTPAPAPARAHAPAPPVSTAGVTSEGAGSVRVRPTGASGRSVSEPEVDDPGAKPPTAA